MVKINVLNDKFWYYPNLVTTSKRRWASRPYSNLKKLMIVEKIIDENFVLSLNGDKNNDFMNSALQIKDFPFTWKKTHAQEIIDNGYIEIKISKKVFIKFDKKSLETLKRGYIPFYSKEAITKIANSLSDSKTKKLVIWRKSGFTDEKKPLFSFFKKN